MDTYLGGERDKLEEVTPKRYEDFFEKSDMYFILVMLVIFLLLVKVVV